MIEELKKLVNGTGCQVVIELREDLMGSSVPDITYGLIRSGQRLQEITTPCPEDVKDIASALETLAVAIPRKFLSVKDGGFHDPDIWEVDGQCGTGLVPGLNDTVTVNNRVTVVCGDDSN